MSYCLSEDFPSVGTYPSRSWTKLFSHALQPLPLWHRHVLHVRVWTHVSTTREGACLHLGHIYFKGMKIKKWEWIPFPLINCRNWINWWINLKLYKSSPKKCNLIISYILINLIPYFWAPNLYNNYLQLLPLFLIYYLLTRPMTF